MTPKTQKQILDILNYWHKVEFFIPFGLDQQIDDLKDWEVKYIYPSSKQASPKSWLASDIPFGLEVSGYNLYLGVFDKSIITEISKKYITHDSSPLEQFEDNERMDLEGDTCFAKIKLNKEGLLSLDSLSISTLPWAIGQTIAGDLHGLDLETFQRSQNTLKRLFTCFLAERGENIEQPLQQEELPHLFDILCEWANFRPKPDHPIAVLVVQTQEIKKKNKKEDQLPKETCDETDTESFKESTDNQTRHNKEEDDDDDEQDHLSKIDFDILNSFYIQDIERAIEAVKFGNIPLTLYQYLLPSDLQNRIDLYTEQGYQTIYDALYPKHINTGHWPANPEHAMSLMQQFAINKALSTLKDSGIFSVNGPPGTGKTTLLRDVFAENIVQRARVLARLDKACDAFQTNTRNVSFSNGKNYDINILIDELTGYEMVVASSNNAAVENISVDLIKRKELASPWQDIQYLQPIAHNLRLSVDSKNIRKSPQGDQMPWGLLSCALGKSANRKKFVERFAFLKVDPEPNEQNPPLHFWNWRKNIDYPTTFKQAADAFQQANTAVNEGIAYRERFITLMELMSRTDKQTYTASQKSACEQVARLLQQTQTDISTTDHELQTLDSTLILLKEQERLIDRQSPAWWERLFRTTRAKMHQHNKIDNAEKQLALHDQKMSLLARREKQLIPQQTELSQKLAQAQYALDDIARNWDLQVEEYEALKKRFSTFCCPKTITELDQDAFQIQGLWHDAEFSQLRSELFVAALNLHEAWLYEVTKIQKKFTGNIYALTTLLDNNKLENSVNCLSVWQSLFMVVPIISTTFASFSNQFRGIGAESLGWLFIDEAGQAVPQAAVGALWRSKRAVVVGDPLQIEPVFTLPSKLINAIGALSTCTQDNQYAPHCVSVQSLADQANLFGTYVKHSGGQHLWIGSPLRVHRRCIEPMFSLSNAIAYDNKMVFGLPSRNKPDAQPVLHESCWIDIGGFIEHKQVVPQQIEFMVHLIMFLYQNSATSTLGDFYVISPFKAMKQALQEALNNADWQKNGQYQKPKALKAWLSSHIGTVHTFQGKEQDTVFMLLGTDNDHLGAAQWASSKANLLNVALTRAKRRYYFVGDYKLWSELPYFDHVKNKQYDIACITPEKFMMNLKSKFIQQITE